MSLVVRDFPLYLNNVPITANESFDWITFGSVNQGSFSIAWTGTWTGTIIIEGANGGHYMTPLSEYDTDIYHTLLDLTITAGAQPDSTSPNKWLAEVLPTSVKGVRISVTVSSGSGTMKAHFFSKSTG